MDRSRRRRSGCSPNSASDDAIRILPRPEPFNFSRLNNAAAREATGDILGLINNDIEVTREDWLDEMVALAMRPEIGCVGAKLLYPDGASSMAVSCSASMASPGMLIASRAAMTPDT